MKILNKLLLVFALVLPVVLYAETWQRVLPAYVDNIYLAGAYSGSVNYSRPAWVDIDGDNDYDFFIGGEHGGMHFYRNNGTPSSPSWTFVTEFYKNIDVGNRSSQTFVDIDADNDYDLFIGNQDGWIAFYRNVGSSTVDTFVLVSSNYLGIDVGSYSAPWFCDIDADGDKDMFIGCQTGTIYYYRNDGTPSTPNFVYVTNNWFSIDIGTRSIPCFADINADGDFDLFIGWAEGTVYYYRNDGTPTTPNMVYVTDSFTTDLGNTTAPSFVDIDNDGDLDMFVGEYIGNVNFYRNTGSATNPNMSYVRRHYVDIDMNSSSTPTFVDIDNDGDYDMFAGEWVGIIDYYQNSGTATNHRWTIVSENYAGIDVGDNSAPTFVDIDADNDFDLFIGNLEGNIYYYRNDGNATTPNFTLVSSNYNSIDVGDRAAPDFIDIDNDNDFDLFIGNNDGVIWFYRNTGTPSVPSWTLVSSNYNNIDVGERAIPYFADVDRDGDFDLFIGEYWGTTFFYRNTGTPSVPAWTFVTNTFAGINVEENTAPTFVDIDNDNDLDLFIGERWGGLNLYLQIVDLTPPKPPFITRVE
ncbi:MAG: VCBS repeat-containing protein, partial [candidate division WOR-3 bacterium]